MKRTGKPASLNRVPKTAVLLIPEPEGKAAPAYGIKPGYYSKPQMVRLLERLKDDSKAIRFIADMLETGIPEYDGFADLLRKSCTDPKGIARILQSCQE